MRCIMWLRRDRFVFWYLTVANLWPKQQKRYKKFTRYIQSFQTHNNVWTAVHTSPCPPRTCKQPRGHMTSLLRIDVGQTWNLKQKHTGALSVLEKGEKLWVTNAVCNYHRLAEGSECICWRSMYRREAPARAKNRNNKKYLYTSQNILK